MPSTAIVARPIEVRPIRIGPSQRKCRFHLCRRGLKSHARLRVLGSIPARFEPLWWLSAKHARERLLEIVLPAMLYGDDVIDLEGEFVEDLWHPTVFTALATAFPNQLDKCDFHGGSSATAGTLEHLPSLGFEGGKNRARRSKLSISASSSGVSVPAALPWRRVRASD